MRFAPLSLGALAVASVAQAAAPPVPGTRALGMGGALRGSATGDSALLLNPSGMSLMRAYVIEAAYVHDKIGAGNTNLGRLSVVDSTSGFNIAGGLYYNYLADEPAGAPKRAGHEGGLALSVPLGEHLFLGGTAKYLRLRNSGTLPAGTPSLVKGFTFDAGLTLKPVNMISIGLVGQNLADLHTDRAPRTAGGGVTVGATSELLFAFDAVLDFTTARDTGGHGNLWSFMGGGEYLLAKRFALRAGGGRRGTTHAGYLAVGGSFVGEVGALDVGFQQDLGGSPKETFIGASARLFLPSPE